jgi:hypothetical protein
VSDALELRLERIERLLGERNVLVREALALLPIVVVLIGYVSWLLFFKLGVR